MKMTCRIVLKSLFLSNAFESVTTQLVAKCKLGLGLGSFLCSHFTIAWHCSQCCHANTFKLLQRQKCHLGKKTMDQEEEIRWWDFNWFLQLAENWRAISSLWQRSPREYRKGLQYTKDENAQKHIKVQCNFYQFSYLIHFFPNWQL